MASQNSTRKYDFMAEDLTQGQVADANQGMGALQAQPSEKLIPQSKVNEIVHERTSAVAEKARREALDEFQRQHQQSMGGMSAMSEQQIKDLISSESKKIAEQQTQQAMYQKMVNEFVDKMRTGKSKYSDFDETVMPLDIPSIPHVVELANGADNTADIMYELGKNPSKVAIISALAVTNPNLAKIEMAKLSNSIKANQAAANQSDARMPLNQETPTNFAADNGKMSRAELKKQPWLRS
jgi:hypothetical protein